MIFPKKFWGWFFLVIGAIGQTADLFGIQKGQATLFAVYFIGGLILLYLPEK